MSPGCPHCGRWIQDDDALLCLYCGSSLERGSGFMGQFKTGRWKYAVLILLVIIIAAFILLQII
jgi:uncharacterized membrane protein YvbJ